MNKTDQEKFQDITDTFVRLNARIDKTMNLLNTTLDRHKREQKDKENETDTRDTTR